MSGGVVLGWGAGAVVTAQIARCLRIEKGNERHGSFTEPPVLQVPMLKAADDLRRRPSSTEKSQLETLESTDENERMLLDEQISDPDADLWANGIYCAVVPGVTGPAVDDQGDMQQSSAGEPVDLERAFPTAGGDPALPKMAIS